MGGHNSNMHKHKSAKNKAKKQTRQKREINRLALANAKIVYEYIYLREFISKTDHEHRPKLNRIRDCFLGLRGDKAEYVRYQEIISEYFSKRSL